MNLSIASYIYSWCTSSIQILLYFILILALYLSSYLLLGTHTTASVNHTLSSHEQIVANKPYVIILYGPPGSGRAITALKLAHRFDIPKISFVELLAQQVHEDSEAGQKTRDFIQCGGETPIDLFWMLLEKRMSKKDCKRGCVWDEMPWTLDQVKLIQKKLLDRFEFFVFSIDASEDWLTQRVEGRLFCSSCGRVYHEPQSLPRREGICDICGYTLQKRVDDRPETVKNRYKRYEKSIIATLKFWKDEELLRPISGNRPLEDIFSDITFQINSAEKSLLSL